MGSISSSHKRARVTSLTIAGNSAEFSSLLPESTVTFNVSVTDNGSPGTSETH